MGKGSRLTLLRLTHDPTPSSGSFSPGAKGWVRRAGSSSHSRQGCAAPGEAAASKSGRPRPIQSPGVRAAGLLPLQPKEEERERNRGGKREAGQPKKPGPGGGARASADAPLPAPWGCGGWSCPLPHPRPHQLQAPRSARKTPEQQAPRACCPHGPVSPSSGQSSQRKLVF